MKSGKISTQSLLTAIPAAAGIAAAINAVLYFAGRSTGILNETVLIEGKEITLLPVVMASVIPTIIAGLVFLLFNRFSSRPVYHFTILSVVLVVLSFYSPTTIPNYTTGLFALLNLMHVVVAAVVVWALGKLTKPA